MDEQANWELGESQTPQVVTQPGLSEQTNWELGGGPSQEHIERLERARRGQQEAFAREGESTAGFFARRSIPFVSAAIGFTDAQRYNAAVQRMQEGRPADEDFQTVAHYEALQEHAANRGFLGRLGSVAASLPAIAGEGYAAGRVLSGAGQALGMTRPAVPAVESMLGRATLPTVGRQVAAYAGRQAAATPLMPSLYAERIAQTGDVGGSLGLAYAQNLVLGTLSGAAGKGIAPTSWGRYFGQIAGRGGLGVIEQQFVDVLGGAVGLPTQFGLIGEIAHGKGVPRTLEDAAIQFLTFGAFAAVHQQFPKAPEIMRRFQETVNAARTPQEAAQSLQEQVPEIRRQLGIPGPIEGSTQGPPPQGPPPIRGQATPGLPLASWSDTQVKELAKSLGFPLSGSRESIVGRMQEKLGEQGLRRIEEAEANRSQTPEIAPETAPEATKAPVPSQATPEAPAGQQFASAGGMRDPYERAGLSPVEREIHSLHNQGVPFRAMETHPNVVEANGGRPVKSPAYVFRQAQEKMAKASFVERALTPEEHAELDNLERQAGRGTLDPKALGGPEKQMELRGKGNRRMREIEEADDIINRLVKFANDKQAAKVFDQLEQAREDWEGGKGHGRFIKALVEARRLLEEMAGRSPKRPVEPPEPAGGTPPIRPAGPGVPPEGRPGGPPAPEGVGGPAAAHPEGPPTAARGGEAAGDFIDYYPAPYPNIQQRAREIHASGSQLKWQDFKDALREAFPGEKTEKFIQSLGKQKITNREGPEHALGTWEKQGKGQDRILQVQHDIEMMRLEHEQTEAAKDPEVHEGFQDGLQAGLEAGQAEEVHPSARNAAQRRAAERVNKGESFEPPLKPGPEWFDEFARSFGEPLTEAERRTFPGGPGAGGAPGEANVTALANRITDREREARGEPPILRQARMADPVVWDQAMERLNRDPEAGAKLVEEINKKSRPTNDIENALLLQRRVALANEHDRAERESIRAFEQGDTALEVARLQKRTSDLFDLRDQTDKAIVKSGSEWGKSGRWRRMLAAEDFSLVGMLQSARAAKGAPLTEAEHAKIRELSARIAELDAQLAVAEAAMKPTSEYGTPEFVVLDKAKTASERGHGEFKDIVKELEQANKPFMRRMADFWIKLRQAFVISGVKVLGKLGAAAGERMGITPLEELAGAGLSRLPGLSKIAAAAPREGRGFNRQTEMKAFGSGFGQGMIDAYQTFKTGKSELDVKYGKNYLEGEQGGVANKWVDWIFQLHAALKAPAVRNEFTRTYLQLQEYARARGEDFTSPAAVYRMSAQAYMKGQEAKFQGDNRAVEAYNRAINYLRRPEASAGAQALGFGMKILLPVVRIPTNIVAEAITYATGSITGSVRAGIALGRGVQNLKPEQADLIMRQLKKGSLGLAAMAIGFFNPQIFGGYYTGRRRDEDVGVGAARTPIGDIPSFVMHNPLLEILQLGATMRRASDAQYRSSPESVGEAIFSGAAGLAEEAPFVRQPIEIGRMMSHNPQERGLAWGQFTKSLFVPQFVQWMAGLGDVEGFKPKPRGVIEHIESGVPGLRQQVPTSRPRGGLQPLRPLQPRQSLRP